MVSDNDIVFGQNVSKRSVSHMEEFVAGRVGVNGVY
jgi:hypothetical protein